MTPEQLETLLLDIKAQNAVIVQRLDTIDGALKRDYKILHGNGQPGLVDRITRLETAANSTWRTIQTAGTIVAALASLIFSILAFLKNTTV